MFQNNKWKLYKLLFTSLIFASLNGHTEIVKMLLEQEGIDINAQDTKLFLSKFILIILYFKVIIGICSNYF